ncbi:virulence factor TspB C-terminal domain-related protein [Aeromonas veronii]
MFTKYKAALFIIAASFSSISNAAYTTMTLEGVKEANGVWTAAGVMDTQGFVRTTGAVSVMGTTRNLPVALSADAVATTGLLRAASRLAGPVALAATAYDVYSWYTSDGIQASGDTWTTGEFDYLNGYCMSLQPSESFGSLRYSLDDCKGLVNSVATYKPVSSVVPHSTNPNILLFRGTPTSYNIGQYSGFTKVPKPLPSDRDSSLPIPSFSVISSGFNKLPSLKGKPIPVTGLTFTPFSEWYGSPYFKDGNWYRDRMDVSPCPTASQPTRVCVDFGPQKFDGATDPNTVPSQATGTASGGAPKQQENDFCKKNPQSIACSELGSLKDEKLPVEERPVDVSYTSWGASNSQCPADKVIPLWDDRSFVVSYSPVCQFATLLRPLVIALALLAAGFIVAGVTRKGGGDA